MRLRFGSADEGAYYATRDALLDELGGYLTGSESDRLIADVGTFIDWRYHYSTGVLDDFAPSDITEFLLEWCPRKVAQSADAAADLCDAVGLYVTFMADTRRLVGGEKRGALLASLAKDLTTTVRAEMADPANFGMGKTLLSGVEYRPHASDEEIRANLTARMNEHNALPLEERKALTDRFFDDDEFFDDVDLEPNASVEPYELPFVYVPPPAADVEASAAAAPLLAKVQALREYLGAAGKQLTDKGNLRLADGRALIDLLGTGDQMDPLIGDKTFRTVSTAELPHLNFILDIAKAAGAVRVHKRRLVSVKAWATKPILQQAAALAGTVIDLGPLESELSGRMWYMAKLHEVLDDGVVHWLAPLLGQEKANFDTFVELALSVVNKAVAPALPHFEEQMWETLTQRDMSHIFEALDDAGVVRWVDRVETPERWGRPHWSGGTVSLTALGRHVVPDLLDPATYVLRRVDDVADGDGAALIEAMLAVSDQHWEALVAGWQLDRPAVARVKLITDAIAANTSGNTRMMGFVVLEMFDVEVVEPLVRELLDTPVAGHAALWLMSRDRADTETVGGFVDVAVLVDVMCAQSFAAPEQLCNTFTNSPDPLALLKDMWRHPAPETALVLDALGNHLPDKKLAKAARKAAMRHRSWMANR